MFEQSCPSCKSTNIRRSHTKGLREKFLKKFGWRAFRCREKNCRWRGLIKMESTSELAKEFIKNHKATIIGIVMMIMLIPLIMGIFIYLLN